MHIDEQMAELLYILPHIPWFRVELDPDRLHVGEFFFESATGCVSRRQESRDHGILWIGSLDHRPKLVNELAQEPGVLPKGVKTKLSSHSSPPGG